MIDQLVAALDLLERVKVGYRKWKNPPQESVASRFIRLFETHGVHRNQIPRFFGHGLSLADLQSEDSLLLKLDEPMLEDACALFAVRRPWLDGADLQVYPHHDFYKRPKEFAQFITQLQAAGPDRELCGILVSPSRPTPGAPAIFVLQEYVGLVGDKAIARHHLCTGWIFEYWKSRAYLAACVALAWKAGIYTRGVVASSETIAKYVEAASLFGAEEIGVFNRSGWYPEDLALEPSTFLHQLDFESDCYGARAGLKLWLMLHDDGLLELSLPSPCARPKFQAELAKYNNGSPIVE
ncbi:hypothetical protein LK540_10965 [Massilia sp. IC2-278]|uniref:hypothetical protein n=1 Tax=Massilia sp. IC2-278 TaxID=2887200 RepID=UPI001E31C8C5|nr:hypothetical protein [Massilia sp. IC2-278]MCC2960946.1 hypothetical protein [Massilia sp. IC2-278]